MRFRRNSRDFGACFPREGHRREAVPQGRPRRTCQVYLACDADPALTEPVAEHCAQAGIPVETDYTMAQLGKACRITVGASVVAVLRE